MQNKHRRRFGGLVLSASLLVMSGCYKATFISNPQVVKGVEHDEWNSFFLWGLVGEESLDVRQHCPGGQVAQVRTGGNVGTVLVSAVTLGIYAPRMSYVWCSGGPAQNAPATVTSEAAPPKDVPSLAIYGDRKGRPVRVERRRGDVLEAVTEPQWSETDHAWRVSFVQEVAK